jgi:hypothetical protein
VDGIDRGGTIGNGLGWDEYVNIRQGVQVGSAGIALPADEEKESWVS